MSRGSDRRKRQLRKVQARRARRQVGLVGKVFRQMLDSQVKPTLRTKGLVGEHGPELSPDVPLTWVGQSRPKPAATPKAAPPPPPPPGKYRGRDQD